MFPAYVEVIIISLIASFLSVMITKFLGHAEERKILKEDMTSLNERIREARDKGDVRRMNKLSEQYMLMTKEQFSVNIKPMILSFITFIGAMVLIWTYYTGWFLLYFGVVIASTFLFRKVFS